MSRQHDTRVIAGKASLTTARIDDQTLHLQPGVCNPSNKTSVDRTHFVTRRGQNITITTYSKRGVWKQNWWWHHDGLAEHTGLRFVVRIQTMVYGLWSADRDKWRMRIQSARRTPGCADLLKQSANSSQFQNWYCHSRSRDACRGPKTLTRAVVQIQVIANSWFRWLLASSWFSPPEWVT